MQTVDKAMTLLSFFSPAEPEIGLSELARLASFDKAATRRFLVALSKHGFIEQNGENRKYRLGSAFLRFARIREATLPFTSIVQPVLDKLATATGETAHASLLAGDSLSTIGIAEPQRATRVYINPSQPLPLHATASGLACLAFGDLEWAEAVLGKGKLPRHTARTTTSLKDLRHLLQETRKRGFGRAERSFEDEVIGTAAPIFDWAGKPLGAIAVASMASRFSKELERDIVQQVLAASLTVTRATGGEPHPAVGQALQRMSK